MGRRATRARSRPTRCAAWAGPWTGDISFGGTPSPSLPAHVFASALRDRLPARHGVAGSLPDVPGLAGPEGSFPALLSGDHAGRVAGRPGAGPVRRRAVGGGRGPLPHLAIRDRHDGGSGRRRVAAAV